MPKKNDTITPPGRVTERSLYYWVLHRHYGLQLFLLLVILISLVFRVIPLEMQKRIINQAIELKNYQLLFLYCGFYCAAILLTGISKYIINYLQILIGQKILVEIRTELYSHILQLPLQFYRTMQTGTVISAMTAELNAIGFFLGGALAVPATSILTYLAFLGFMLSVNPLLALLSSTLFPLELFIIPKLQKRYNNWNKERIQIIRKMSNVVNESVSGIQDVQSYAGFAFEEQRLQGYIEKLYSSLKRLFVIKYGIKFTDNLFQSFGPMILFLVGGIFIIRGQFTIGALVAFLSAYEKIYDPWKEMLAFYQSYQDAQVRYKQIMKSFNLEPVCALMPPDCTSVTGKIEMHNVDFSLTDGTRLLNKINLTFHPGEQVAIVGFSGSGKSTLALLLDQLCEPTGGKILLDGRDISTVSKTDISNAITMISQKPFIFSGTIRDNLLYGVTSNCQENIQPPEQQKLFQLLRDVGFEDDVLWFGINSILSEEQVQKHKEEFLQMRKIVHMELGEHFNEVVEFYDVNTFLFYATIRDNLIFGDSRDGAFRDEQLVQHPAFLRLLEEMDLEEELLRLGLAIARLSIEITEQATKIDEQNFFDTTPMHIDDVALYRELINELTLHPSRLNEEKNLLFKLALNYIPARHTLLTLSPSLAEKLLSARHYFLKTIMQIDIGACHSAGQDFLTGMNGKEEYTGEQAGKFITFCPFHYLYHQSLRNNILFGSPKKGNQDIIKLRSIVWKSFRKHGLLDDILTIGLEYNVGSQGSRLSGGQQQKLAIARGLLKKTPVLILDEATSGLDNESQAQIQNLLSQKYRGKTTVIAIIHRLDLAHHYDKIIVLKNGAVVENGSFNHLMEQKALFYYLLKGAGGAA